MMGQPTCRAEISTHSHEEKLVQKRQNVQGFRWVLVQFLALLTTFFEFLLGHQWVIRSKLFPLFLLQFSLMFELQESLLVTNLCSSGYGRPSMGFVQRSKNTFLFALIIVSVSGTCSLSFCALFSLR
jgi:hypothetical protein